MVDPPYTRHTLPERSHQAVVRSELRKKAVLAGFTGHRLAEVEIIIAEITSNLVKHSEKEGMLLARHFTGAGAGLELIMMDNGPGMKLPLKMMEDGQSTKNTLGHGLGAIQRLSNSFDLYSLHGWGTILFSRIYVNKDYKPIQDKLDVGVLCTSKEDNAVCGDAWSYINDGKKIRIILIDGLGHGPIAHKVALEAVSAFKLSLKKLPTEQLRTLNESLRKTRGAVAAIAHIDNKNHELMYSGVGNIAMKLISPVTAQGCFSYNGIIGHIMPASLNNHIAQWNDKTHTLIMHSDGLSGRWDIKKYPGILNHRSIMLCSALYKDHNRGNDDTTILVAKSQNELWKKKSR